MIVDAALVREMAGGRADVAYGRVPTNRIESVREAFGAKASNSPVAAS
jgi:hypothetical protein